MVAYWLPFLGLVAALLYARQRRYSRSRLLGRTAKVLVVCHHMLGLIAQLQQHRGMSTAFLSGEAGFLERLLRKGSVIDGNLPALRQLVLLEKERTFPVLSGKELALFGLHWGQLRERLASLSVEQSIAQHGLLIGQLLKWLAALAESRIEPALGAKVPSGLVRNYLVRLPALSELLGQARALGTSVASQRACSAVARVRLMFLVARAEVMLTQALNVSGNLPEAARAMRSVQQMARVVRTQMLLSSGIVIEAETYFAISTVAIDAVFDWITVSGHWLAAGLEREQEMPGAICHA